MEKSNTSTLSACMRLGVCVYVFEAEDKTFQSDFP